MLHNKGIIKTYPPVGGIRKGDFQRLTPFSTEFGFDRGGGPIDRFYIDKFLQEESSNVKGRVLEIENNEYTMRYGKSNVTQSDILHVNDTNPRATIVGDLTQLSQVADNTFDCIILTQTLHLIYDFDAAVATCYRILKPGGVLLLTSPGITPIDHGEWINIWYWSFTVASLSKMISRSFSPDKVHIHSYGNVFVATAFLYGMSLHEVTEKQLLHQDVHYPVIITVKAIKA